MDRLQVIAALQKWIEARRQEVAFQAKFAEVLSAREGHRQSVQRARAALTAAMAQMASEEKSPNCLEPFRIVIPNDGILIELQPREPDIVCSQIDITLPAKATR